MRTILKMSKVVNVIALMFLLLGPYGLAITGALQVLAAILYLYTYPKNRLIYFYFGLVLLFFFKWDYENFSWIFAIPFFLIVFLSSIIHFQKNKL